MSVAGAPMSDDLGLTQVQLGVVLAGVRLGLRDLPVPGRGLRRRAGRAPRGRRCWRWPGALVNLLVAAVPGTRRRLGDRGGAGAGGARLLMGAAQAPLFPIIGGAATCNWFPVSGWGLPELAPECGADVRLRGGRAADRVADGAVRLAAVVPADGAAAASCTAAVWWWYVRDCPSQHPEVNRGGARPDRSGPHRGRPGAGRAGRVARRAPAPPAAGAHGGVFLRQLRLLLLLQLAVRLPDREPGVQAAGGRILRARRPGSPAPFGAVLGGWTVRPSVEAARGAARLPHTGRGRRWRCAASSCMAAAGAPHPLLAVVLLSLCLGRPAVHRSDLLGRGDRRRPGVARRRRAACSIPAAISSAGSGRWSCRSRSGSSAGRPRWRPARSLPSRRRRAGW